MMIFNNSIKQFDSLSSFWKHLLEDRASLYIIILAIFYLVGIIGFVFSIHPDFVLLTPFQLLLSSALMLLAHPKWNQNLTRFIIICFLVGFGAEVFGVQTGILFGNYEYGRVLGFKLWETPLMIGVNWVLLAYSAGMLVNWAFTKWHWLFKTIMAAALMVLLDVLIEPVAVEYNFWTWATSEIPLQNYFGWFLVSLIVLSFFFRLLGNEQNKVGRALFILQILFFLIIGWTI